MKNKLFEKMLSAKFEKATENMRVIIEEGGLGDMLADKKYRRGALAWLNIAIHKLENANEKDLSYEKVEEIKRIAAAIGEELKKD